MRNDGPEAVEETEDLWNWDEFEGVVEPGQDGGQPTAVTQASASGGGADNHPMERDASGVHDSAGNLIDALFSNAMELLLGPGRSGGYVPQNVPDDVSLTASLNLPEEFGNVLASLPYELFAELVSGDVTVGEALTRALGDAGFRAEAQSVVSMPVLNGALLLQLVGNTVAGFAPHRDWAFQWAVERPGGYAVGDRVRSHALLTLSRTSWYPQEGQQQPGGPQEGQNVELCFFGGDGRRLPEGWQEFHGEFTGGAVLVPASSEFVVVGTGMRMDGRTQVYLQRLETGGGGDLTPGPGGDTLGLPGGGSGGPQPSGGSVPNPPQSSASWPVNDAQGSHGGPVRRAAPAAPATAGGAPPGTASGDTGNTNGEGQSTDEPTEDVPAELDGESPTGAPPLPGGLSQTAFPLDPALDPRLTAAEQSAGNLNRSRHALRLLRSHYATWEQSLLPESRRTPHPLLDGGPQDSYHLRKQGLDTFLGEHLLLIKALGEGDHEAGVSRFMAEMVAPWASTPKTSPRRPTEPQAPRSPRRSPTPPRGSRTPSARCPT